MKASLWIGNLEAEREAGDDIAVSIAKFGRIRHFNPKRLWDRGLIACLFALVPTGPKCKTYVTFRHGDFDENTFYCAACSGWFTVNPATNPIAGGDNNNTEQYTHSDDEGSRNHPYDDMLDKTVKVQQRRHANDPQVLLLRQVPDTAGSGVHGDPKIYTTRQSGRGDVDGDSSVDEPPPPQEPQYEIKKMPTPQQIMNKLNDYVIGQKEVKVACTIITNEYIWRNRSKPCRNCERSKQKKVALLRHCPLIRLTDQPCRK